jgi:hypothetical protein
MPNVTTTYSAILWNVLRLPAALEIAVRQAAGNGAGLPHPLTPGATLHSHRPFLGSVPALSTPSSDSRRPASAQPLLHNPSTP